MLFHAHISTRGNHDVVEDEELPYESTGIEDAPCDRNALMVGLEPDPDRKSVV